MGGKVHSMSFKDNHKPKWYYISWHISHSFLTFQIWIILRFSNKDVKWVCNIFKRNKSKDGSKLFDLEKDDGFRLFVPQRDIQPGEQMIQKYDEGMKKSQSILFIISRLAFLFLLLKFSTIIINWIGKAQYNFYPFV